MTNESMTGNTDDLKKLIERLENESKPFEEFAGEISKKIPRVAASTLKLPKELEHAGFYKEVVEILYDTGKKAGEISETEIANVIGTVVYQIWLENYSPEVDIDTEEGRDAFDRMRRFEDKILAKPLSGLSYEELLVLRKILVRIRETNASYRTTLETAVAKQPEERPELMEDEIQSFYDILQEVEDAEPESDELEIVEGLIRKAEAANKEKK